MLLLYFKVLNEPSREQLDDDKGKSNPRKNLIYGQRHCGKGRNARSIITARHRGGVHKRIYREIDALSYRTLASKKNNK